MPLTLDEALKRIAEAELPGFMERPVDSVHSRSLLGDTPLHIAAIWGDVEMASVLIEAGADIDALGEDECTPLLYAIQQQKVEVARLLILHGADLRTKDRCGVDAIDACERSSHPEVNALLRGKNA